MEQLFKSKPYLKMQEDVCSQPSQPTAIKEEKILFIKVEPAKYALHDTVYELIIIMIIIDVCTGVHKLIYRSYCGSCC